MNSRINGKRGVWCLMGDFNSAWTTQERRDSRNLPMGGRDMQAFKKFIGDMEVEDIPMVGRKFTWYRVNDHSKSRLDRVLVSSDWVNEWTRSTQYVMNRSFTNHCPP